MCSSRKYPYSPHRKDWKFLGDGRFSKIKKIKEMYGVSLDFPEGWGFLSKIHSVGDVWNLTFYGTMYTIYDHLPYTSQMLDH